MHEREENRLVGRLMRDFTRSRMTRREMLTKAAAAGAGAATLSMLAGPTRRYASAKQSSPTAGGPPGWSLTVPAGLRSDLSGQSIRAVLSSSSDPDLAWAQAALAKFSEATGIAAELVNGEQTADARLQAYRNDWAAESSENDVYQIDVIWPGVAAAHALDLSQTLTDLASIHFPALIQNNTVDGALVGMPWFTDAGLLYYRTDLLEKYGLNPPATWAELTTSAQTIQDGERAANPGFNGYVFQGNAYEGLTCNGLEWQVSNGGGNIIEPDGTISINNPQAIAAFERAKGWVGTIAPEDVTGYIEADSLNVWVAGNAAFCRNWPYMWSASQDPASSTVAGKFDVSPLPKGDGDNARNADTLGGWQMMVSKYSTKQDAAIEFVKFMCSPEVEKSMAIERSHTPTIESLYDDPDVSEATGGFFPRLKDVFTGGAVVRPSTVSSDLYPEISATYSQQLNAVLTGSKSAADAVAAMEESFKASLEGE